VGTVATMLCTGGLRFKVLSCLRFSQQTKSKTRHFFLLVVRNTRAGNHPITSSQCGDATQARKAHGDAVFPQNASPTDVRQGNQGAMQNEHLNAKA